jgi:protein phosphatase
VTTDTSKSAAPSSVTQVEVWGATDVGREREGNEDSIYPNSAGGALFTPKPETVARKGRLLVVADGVGGAQAGSEASQWAIRRVVERYYELPGNDLGADLRSAVAHANASLTQYLQSLGVQNAGSTMTAVVLHEGTMYVANVGDSRAYLVRDGQIYRQTRDHTLTQRKLEQGLIREDQVELDPDKNVLVRSLGAKPTVEVDLFPPVPLEPGDLVLLCSDGLYDMISDDEIRRLALSGPPNRAVARLINEANKQGGYDNVSVIIAQVGPRPKGAAAPALAGAGSSLSGRPLLIALGVALALLLIGGGGLLGWRMVRGRGDDPTPAPVVSDGTPTATAIPIGGEDQPTEGAPEDGGTGDPEPGEEGRATSTPRPTATHTPSPTPRPGRPRATNTPVPIETNLPTPDTSPPTEGPAEPPPDEPEPEPPPDEPEPEPPPKETTPPPPEPDDG